MTPETQAVVKKEEKSWTSDEIRETIPPLEERETDRLQVFIPGRMAAVCADCDGVFLIDARKCPGCGSSSYALMSKINEALLKGR